MLQGDLRRKFCRPLDEDAEDLLTSMVLGTLAYLPTELGLNPLLRRARNGSGNALDLALQHETVSWHFWPSIPEHGGQPDVVVAGRSAIDGGRRTIVIEAKLHADKSSRELDDDDDEGGGTTDSDEDDVGPLDQLAKYRVGIEARGLGRRLAAGSSGRVDVVFLTAHTTPPFAAMDESIRALDAAPVDDDWLYWLSWHDCEAVLGDASAALDLGLAQLARDAQAVLIRRGFKAFQGWRMRDLLIAQGLGSRVRYGATRGGWFAQDLRRLALPTSSTLRFWRNR